MTLTRQAGQWIVITYPQYDGVVAPLTYPPVFRSLAAIPHILDTTAMKTLPVATVEASGINMSRDRNSYWSASFAIDTGFVETIRGIFKRYADPVLAQRPVGVDLFCSYQAITKGVLRNMANEGGNSLGLDPAGQPLFFMNFSGMWSNKADDALVLDALRKIYDESVRVAKERGLYSPYIYMNYATGSQDVIGSYGQVSRDMLRAVSRKYDPTGVFQRLQPGYFKL